MRALWVLCLCCAVLSAAREAYAQVDGHVSVLFDVLPDVSDAQGQQDVAELRTRLFAERQDDIGEHWRLRLSGYVDGLVADRANEAIVRPMDLYAEYRAARFDLRAGYSRIVWGRLDEFQPTDVVNPIDLTRFLLEGRSEARLPIAMVRGRLFLSDAATLEGIVAPVFRASTFDQLDEPTSPFNLVPPVARTRREPAATSSNVQGGARLTSTAGRVDYAVSAYRGFRTFPVLELAALGVDEQYPRFTMLGADFETARGVWGFRGEAALFVDDRLQLPTVPRSVDGHSVEAGVGADRRAGDYRVAANLLISSRQGGDEIDDTDVSVVASVDRNFARDTRRIRVFTVYDPADDTVFARVIAAFSLRDNVWLEGSGGLFAGSSTDTIGRLTRRDFVYARLKVFF